MRLVSPIRWFVVSALAGAVLGTGAPAQRPRGMGQQGMHHSAPPQQIAHPQAQQHPQPQQQQQHPQARPQTQPQTAPIVRQNAPAAQQSAGGSQGGSQTAPIERREPPPAVTARVSPNNVPASGNSNVKGDHLAEWMSKHSNLSPEQQQQALEKEPGFHDMPQVTQQRQRDELARLNAMPPAERQKTIERTEALERLTPEQRTQWRGAMQQFTSLPQDQKREVTRSFIALRALPLDQRAAALNSGRYTYRFNDAQRSALNNLIRVEPWLPAGIGPGAK